MAKSDIINYEALWESALKCQRGVRWKPSTKQFVINAPTDVLAMHDKLADGTWKNGKPHKILIKYPKKREGLAISFRDRVYQRSINDSVLYPEMTRHFIFDNAACQTGKGTSFARRRMKEHLWNHYCHYGTKGYILQIDIHGYYPNMRHDVVKAKFGRYLDDDTYKMVCGVLDEQYSGDVGYNPGSQMVQIAGISVLDDLDHYIKEQLRVKHYMRYMDDFTLIHHSKDYLQNCLTTIVVKLNEMGFVINQKKTVIRSLDDGFRYLGFDYRITDTGKIIMTVAPETVKHERRKLQRMVAKCKRGEMSKAKADECLRSFLAYIDNGNSHHLKMRLIQYYKDLWRYDNVHTAT